MEQGPNEALNVYTNLRRQEYTTEGGAHGNEVVVVLCHKPLDDRPRRSPRLWRY